MLSLLHKVPRLQGPGDERKMALGDLQVSSEDGALQAVPSGQDGGKAVWPSTLGEGDKEQVDASQGKDGVKVKSKQKKEKHISEEQRREGLKENGAGRQTKALKLEEGSGDWRGYEGMSRRGRTCGLEKLRKKKMNNVVLVTSPHQRLWFPEKSKKGRRTTWAEQGLRKQRDRDKGMGSWGGMGGRRGPSGVDWAAPGRTYGGRSEGERR